MVKLHFSSLLLSWYRLHARRLPWRDSRDPYLIWISEIILQQTRVAQGLDYYRRFVTRFPNVAALAMADESEVMKYWEGLGYYSRARNLHAAACQIMEMGQFPNTFDSIRSLKGVGDYTAAAIASFAFSLPYAVVDGNVYRVLSRYLGIDKPIDSVEGKKYFAVKAAELLNREHPADYNQAIMDFGALQCVPKNPSCSACPMASDCVAFHTDRVASLPVKSGKSPLRPRYFTFIYIKKGEQYAFSRRESGDIWAGLCQPLLLEWDHHLPDIASLSERLSAMLDVPVDTLQTIGSVVHQRLSHQHLHASFYVFDISAVLSKITLPSSFFWVASNELSNLAFPKMLSDFLSLLIK